jgi:uncharacterized repeat protein (TIGR03809 family)
MSDLTRSAFSRDILVRGRRLAEGRMAFLTELYDSGRWRRYHSKQEFLDIVRESRAALDKWTALAAMPGESAILVTPSPLLSGLENQSSHDEPTDDPLAEALAAISLEMGLDQTGSSAAPVDFSEAGWHPA